MDLVPLDYPSRLDALPANEVALLGLLARYPDIKAIAFNGALQDGWILSSQT